MKSFLFIILLIAGCAGEVHSTAYEFAHERFARKDLHLLAQTDKNIEAYARGYHRASEYMMKIHYDWMGENIQAAWRGENVEDPIHDALVAVAEKNPKMTSCMVELQILFVHLYSLQNGEIRVTECHRSRERQAELVEKGFSKTRNSQHNFSPSRALDFVPCLDEGCKEVSFTDVEQIAYIHGMTRAIFVFLKREFYFENENWRTLSLRSGFDWESDGSLCSAEQRKKKRCFLDGFHVELRHDKGYTEDMQILDELGLFRYL